MGLGYGWEKFSVAVQTAASSQAALQERLASCFVFGLFDMERDFFPDDETFERYQSLFAKTKEHFVTTPGGDTTVNMTDEEAAHCLKEICGVFSDIARAYGAQRYP